MNTVNVENNKALYKLAFIGAGKMATAIAGGLIKSHLYVTDEIVAAEPAELSQQSFFRSTGISCFYDNLKAVDSADVILLAVKPQIAEDVLTKLRGQFANKLLISIAAGLSIQKIVTWIDSDRVIRVMPNTPAMVGMGAAVYSCATGIEITDRTIVEDIFGSVGTVIQLEESKLDSVTALSGSGPAYVFEFIQAMVDGAVASGLDPETSLELFLQTVSGSAEMVRLKMGSPDQLRQAVTSPGGTTEAGLKVLHDANFRDLIKKVILNAKKRSLELGNG